MKSIKQLGIWMDHSIAHLMDFSNITIVSSTISSPPKLQDRDQNLKDESLMHNKEQNQLSDYNKKLSEVIKHYEHVVLFGPTEAKNELLNELKADLHFEKIKIEVKSTDKMTENQQHAFVKDYFHAS